jgi:hypothetical protein
VVHSPGNQEETAWAEGSHKFSDKGWGWYDDYFYSQTEPPITILYGTEYSTDTLKVYQLNITNSGSDPILILKEYVGDNPGTFDASAYDYDNQLLYYVNYNSQELYRTHMNDTLSSSCIGLLDGIASSATFYEGYYYYVDETTNNIIKVTFDTEGDISSEDVLSTIPNSISVTDIAMSPAGDFLYILGDVDGGATEMITWDIINDSYATIGLSINQGSQVAFGGDGNLYAIEPNGGTGSLSYHIDINTGIINPINEDSIIVIDPFSDLAKGPLL